MGTWWLLAVINWDDKPQARGIELAQYGITGAEGLHCLDFWGASYQRLGLGQPLQVALPAHGSAVFALRAPSRDPQWVGDTLHISQGLSVHEWLATENGVRARLSLPHTSTGQVWMSLGYIPQSASFDGINISWRPVDQEVIVFALPRLREGSLVGLEGSWMKLAKKDGIQKLLGASDTLPGVTPLRAILHSTLRQITT